MMTRSPHRRILILLLVSIATLGTAMRSDGWENIRSVQMLLLLSAGMCIGVALSLVMQLRNAPAEKDPAP